MFHFFSVGVIGSGSVIVLLLVDGVMAGADQTFGSTFGGEGLMFVKGLKWAPNGDACLLAASLPGAEKIFVDSLAFDGSNENRFVDDDTFGSGKVSGGEPEGEDGGKTEERVLAGVAVGKGEGVSFSLDSFFAVSLLSTLFSLDGDDDEEEEEEEDGDDDDELCAGVCVVDDCLLKKEAKEFAVFCADELSEKPNFCWEDPKSLEKLFELNAFVGVEEVEVEEVEVEVEVVGEVDGCEDDDVEEDDDVVDDDDVDDEFIFCDERSEGALLPE